MPPETDWVGRLIDGRYEILSALGAGGMGTTYHAADRRQYGRSVAIKVPSLQTLASVHLKARFVEEVRQLTKRSHPHIVDLYDSGQLDGVPYAVMQYLPGGTLRDRMKPDGARLSPAAVAKWLVPIADALDTIHHDVLHRDVKPENILFDANDNAHLIDFGIAKVLADPMLVTATGMVPGTPPYMSPEALAGRPIGPASDQYALAVVIYEALTGDLPQDDRLRALLEVVPGRAADVVQRGLSNRPADRFESCGLFASDFARAIARPRGVGLAGGMAAAAAIVVAAIGWYTLAGPARSAAVPAATSPPAMEAEPALAPPPVAGQDAPVAPPAPVPTSAGSPAPPVPRPITLPPTSDRPPSPASAERLTAPGSAAPPAAGDPKASEDADVTRAALVLAGSLFDRGDYDGATRHYQAAQDRDPGNGVAREGIQRIQRARSAETVARQPGSCTDAIALQDLRELIGGAVPDARLRQFIESCGVQFSVSADLDRDLRKRGASDGVMSLLIPPADPVHGVKWVSPIDRREMVWIAGGSFQMGSPSDERGRDDDETRHAQSVRGFWLDTGEVTYDAFRRFLRANPEWQKGRIDPRLRDDGYLKDWNGVDYPAGRAHWPVVNVNWFAARAYAAWAGRRLPTEAEWEFAGRAGSTTSYWWGDAFFASRTTSDPQAAGPGADVRRSNPWSLFDMSGNVWEWTSSAYRPYPYRLDDGREDPGAGGARVQRGGSWANAAQMLRSANRKWENPEWSGDLVGFRCAR